MSSMLAWFEHEIILKLEYEENLVMATKSKRTKKQPSSPHGVINKDEIFLMVTSLSNERGVPEEVIFTAIEAALASVAEKHYSEQHAKPISLKVTIDRDSGECETMRYWEVLDADGEVVDDADKTAQDVSTSASMTALKDFEKPAISDETHMTLEKAHTIDAELQPGDRVQELFTDAIFTGRIAAQYARQLIMQKVHMAERAAVKEQYEPRIGELLGGTVRRVTRDSVIVELGRHVEGIISRRDLIGHENFRVNDRVRAALVEVRTEQRGPQLVLSRVAPQMVIELFKIEVPEIGEGIIQVMAAARDPGVRAKVAVKTNDGRIDPIGACVGMRGARVQAVINELNGERIDIVLWDDNPAKLVINAMAPAEIESIVVNEDQHTMDLAVSEEGLSLAIGRGGQNVRLASELTGWKLNVMTATEASVKQNESVVSYQQDLMQKLDIDEDFAEVLVVEGFTTLESVAYAPLEEVMAIEGFDEEIAEELQQRAREVIAEKEKELQDKLQTTTGGGSLLELEGMTTEVAAKLVAAEILTQEDLADQSVFELTDLGIDKDLAAALIMQARAAWYTE